MRSKLYCILTNVSQAIDSLLQREYIEKVEGKRHTLAYVVET